MENFLEGMKNSRNLVFEDELVASLLETFFIEFPEFQGFSYLIYQQKTVSVVTPGPHGINDLKKNLIEETVPFYQNKLKLNLFKDILNEIRVSKK